MTNNRGAAPLIHPRHKVFAVVVRVWTRGDTDVLLKMPQTPKLGVSAGYPLISIWGLSVAGLHQSVNPELKSSSPNAEMALPCKVGSSESISTEQILQKMHEYDLRVRTIDECRLGAKGRTEARTYDDGSSQKVGHFSEPRYNRKTS